MHAARRILPSTSPLVLCLAGLLFATHPIHTDAVSSINNRTEMLSACFALGSFLAFTSAFNLKDRTLVSYKKLALSLFLPLLGLMCKEQSITVIAINMVYDFVVVNGLDVPTFLRALYATFVAGDGNVAELPEPGSKLDKLKAPKKVVKKHGKSPAPQWLLDLLFRLALQSVVLVALVLFRLRQNGKSEDFREYYSRSLAR